MPDRKTERLEARITPETARQVADLARLRGGPVKPLAKADVFAEAIRLALETAKAKEEQK